MADIQYPNPLFHIIMLLMCYSLFLNCEDKIRMQFRINEKTSGSVIVDIQTSNDSFHIIMLVMMVLLVVVFILWFQYVLI